MMLLSPLTVFWMLVLGGVTIVALARFRFRYLSETATMIAGLTTLFWYALRARLPLVVTVSNWPAAAQLSPWNWRVDQIAWQLSGGLLLVLLGILLVERGSNTVTGEDAGEPIHSILTYLPVQALALLLTAASLAAIWAESLAGLMAAWMMLVLLLGVTAFFTKGADEAGIGPIMAGSGWLLSSLFFLWLAAAEVGGINAELIRSDWARIPSSSVLTAGLLQLGVWPVLGWRQMVRSTPSPIRAMSRLLPPLVGASLLIRVVTAGDISAGYSLFLTAFALLGLLLSAYRAWIRLNVPYRQLAALAAAEASMLLLVGVWAGPEALATETRVMVLALGILFVAASQEPARMVWWQKIPAWIALGSMAGLPLTAAFAGRIALYGSWLTGGRFILLLATLLIQMPLLIAVASRFWGVPAADEGEAAASGIGFERTQLVRFAGMSLPALALLSGSGLSQISGSWGSVLAILILAIVVLLFLRFVTDLAAIRDTLLRAFAGGFSTTPFRESLSVAWRQIGAVVQDATAVLEGEGGVLWLIVLALIFLLIR